MSVIYIKRTRELEQRFDSALTRNIEECDATTTASLFQLSDSNVDNTDKTVLLIGFFEP
jgi:hypothetical protein